MPGLARNLKFNIRPQDLAQRPELATRIAIISSMWAEVETKLSLIFALAVGADPQTCHAMLAEVNNITTRVRMIAQAVERLDGPHAPFDFKKYSLKERFGRLIEPIRKRASERGAMLHAAWMIHKDYPNSLFRFDGLSSLHNEGTQEWRLPDFREVEERIQELSSRLGDFHMYLDEYREQEKQLAAERHEEPQSGSAEC